MEEVDTQPWGVEIRLVDVPMVVDAGVVDRAWCGTLLWKQYTHQIVDGSEGKYCGYLRISNSNRFFLLENYWPIIAAGAVDREFFLFCCICWLHMKDYGPARAGAILT